MGKLIIQQKQNICIAQFIVEINVKFSRKKETRWEREKFSQGQAQNGSLRDRGQVDIDLNAVRARGQVHMDPFAPFPHFCAQVPTPNQVPIGLILDPVPPIGLVPNQGFSQGQFHFNP